MRLPTDPDRAIVGVPGENVTVFGARGRIDVFLTIDLGDGGLLVVALSPAHARVIGRALGAAATDAYREAEGWRR